MKGQRGKMGVTVKGLKMKDVSHHKTMLLAAGKKKDSILFGGEFMQ